MRYKQTTFLLIFLLALSTLFSARKIKEKDLPEKHREWLRQTSYIILPQEKDVFMQLTSDKERDIFIEAFWQQRDPTPGTPQNEYKRDHKRRLIDVAPACDNHFLNDKGVMSTDYLTNYIESTAEIALTLDPALNISFLHFCISPVSFSVDYFEPKDQYYCNFKLNVSLRKDTEIIFQYSKDFPFYFYPDEADKINGNGISIQDAFPVIEGNYRLNILIQNSVGKEFSVFEKDIYVPKNSGPAKLTGPVLGVRLQESPTHLYVPFKVLDTKLLVDPNNIFSSTDVIVLYFNLKNVTKDLWQEGKVEVLINDLSNKNPSNKSFNLDLRNYPYNKTFCIIRSISLQGLRPDHYKIKINLKDGKRAIIDEEATNFIVSSKKIVPHPIILAKSISPSKNFLYFYSLAYQYDKVNELEKAEAAYEKARVLKPECKAGLVEYAYFLKKIKKFNKSLELIEGIKEDEKFKFDYYLIRGNILMEMGNYPDAIDNLLEANKIYNSEVRLLNCLGFCFYKTDQKKKALDALRASLSLDSQQENIKKLIQEIEKIRD
jgi:GWxTD domain-containing protein